MRTLKEIIQFFEPETVHTNIWIEKYGYVSGFTYFSEKHEMYQFVKEKGMTLNDLIKERGEEIPKKLNY